MHNVANTHRPPVAVFKVAMFGVLVRVLWFMVLACVLAFELIPLSLAFEAKFPPIVFYFYEATKLIAFFIFGFLTPITWWTSQSLGKGALFAILTTAVVEFGQSVIPGHRTSVLELAVKLVLLFTGFVSGLDIRKYQQLVIGPLCVRFSSRYWSDPF
jgi:hypothetical protein